MFENLMKPGQINSYTTKNRIRFAPQITNMCDPKTGEASDQEINYLREKAIGGCGIVTAQGGYVQPIGKGYPRQMAMDTDDSIVWLKKIADAIKEHGAMAMSQVMHVGRLAHPKYAGVDSLPVGPTAMKPMIPRFQTCREISKEEIKETVKQHGIAALRGKKAGFEGVDICGINGYFISSFQCAYSNKRTDEYGGSVENRARVGCEIIEAIRETCGPDYPILLRMCASDHRDDGTTPEEYARMAVLAQEAGADALSAAVGMYESIYPAITSDIKPGKWLYLAKGWKTAGVTVPVLMAYRMNRPDVAEKAIADGVIDYWEMMRPLMADPYIAQKVAEGRPEDIALCVACNYGCFTSTEAQQCCTMNPRFGKEGDESLKIKPTDAKKKVMVVGGGPGGMEAARVAAMRGHDVTLYEKENQLGGQLIFVVKAPTLDEWEDVRKYWITQLDKTGVKVVTGSEVTKELVEQEKPDQVIVAAGPDTAIPDVPGADGKNVVSALDAMADKVPVGDKVIVWGGWFSASHIADTLASQGKKVTLITDKKKYGMGIALTNNIGIKIRLKMGGVKAMGSAVLEKITDTGVVVTDKHGEKQTIEADTIVIATFKKNRKLAEELDISKEFIVGDCKAPRRIFGAVHEGYKAGLKA